jgi:hypothetical protein
MKNRKAINTNTASLMSNMPLESRSFRGKKNSLNIRGKKAGA